MRPHFLLPYTWENFKVRRLKKISLEILRKLPSAFLLLPKVFRDCGLLDFLNFPK